MHSDKVDDVAKFTGSLKLLREKGAGLRVAVDLVEDRLEIRSASTIIGSWPLDSVGVRAEDTGFHLVVEGEEIMLEMDDDPGFALAMGVHSASPIMRRRISAALHERDH